MLQKWQPDAAGNSNIFIPKKYLTKNILRIHFAELDSALSTEKYMQLEGLMAHYVLELLMFTIQILIPGKLHLLWKHGGLHSVLPLLIHAYMLYVIFFVCKYLSIDIKTNFM